MWVGEITLNGESLSGFGSLNLENPVIYPARERGKEVKAQWCYKMQQQHNT